MLMFVTEPGSSWSACFKRHLPALPGIPHPVPVVVGSCYRLSVLRLLQPKKSCSRPSWLASIASSSPPFFSLSSAPQIWSHSIWTQKRLQKNLTVLHKLCGWQLEVKFHKSSAQVLYLCVGLPLCAFRQCDTQPLLCRRGSDQPRRVSQQLM